MVPPKKTSTKPDKTPKESPGDKPRARSPKKPRSPGRPKSPARQKSPGRPKSPARAKAEPADSKRRKSTDLVHSPTRSSSGRVVTPTRRSPIRSSPSRGKIPVATKKPAPVVYNETDSDTADEKIEVKEKPRAAVRGRTRVDLIEKVEDKKEPSAEPSVSVSQISKRITRSHNKEVERIVHLKHFEVTSKKLYEFSDEDEQVSNKDEAKKVAGNVYWRPLVGVIAFMLTIVALGPWLFAFCDQTSCSFLKPAQKPSLASFFNLKALLSYWGFLLYVALLTALPFGGKKVTGLPDKHGKLEYTTNGLFATLMTLGALALMHWKQIPVLDFIVANQRGLFGAAVLTGLILSVFAYVRSLYVPVSALNSQTVGKGGLYNFFMGQEVHPRVLFGLLDLKVFVYRVALLSQLLITLAWLSRAIPHSKQINLDLPKDLEGAKQLLNVFNGVSPTFFVLSSLISLRIFDALLFEGARITSKEIQQEGFGYRMGMSYLVYPFLFSFVHQYVLEHQVALAPWKLVLVSLVFVAGLVVARLSDNQKDAFRKNPYSPVFAHLESIPTVNGKKILSSGWWGWVRHPNYFGAILTQMALVPFVVCAPPVAILYLSVAHMIWRARTDDLSCHQKYGIPWERYCNKVPHLLVPRVY